MTFSRVKPGNWAVGEELTSSQMNTLDTDHSNAVDKTGDTISGTIHVSGAGKISADLHDTIVSTVDSGISTTVSRGISINNDNGLSLDTVGAWPSFRSTRSLQWVIPPITTLMTGGWTFDSQSLIGPGTTGGQVVVELIAPHNGATLSTLDVVFAAATHGAVPATLPSVNVQRVQSGTTLGVAITGVSSLSSAGAGGYAFFPTPGSGAAYTNSNLLQKWTFTANQNNVIDRSQYRYLISLVDEGGANAVIGNKFLYFIAHFTGITNMAFP